ncbi:hypothetical protein B9Z19DRAFT_1077551 [Tuber borchii]|uniref:Secreted protein n=1 Tax=Tuber borchii TaxID=42251 RepID=A0A2T7A0R7_TUBBO|nr:hypothetical protein B9Z19DRAFT_1077551 [Tuber borchii]
MYGGVLLSFLLLLLSPSIVSPTILFLPNPYSFPSLHHPVVCSVCGICCILACLYREQVKLECVCFRSTSIHLCSSAQQVTIPTHYNKPNNTIATVTDTLNPQPTVQNVSNKHTSPFIMFLMSSSSFSYGKR